MNRVWAQQSTAGTHIPAIKRITLFSPNEWEEFVEEWLTTKKKYYDAIERIGGAGDQGRDVMGFITQSKSTHYQWDNYQCKHYDHPLFPSDVWGEFGKLCYYTYLGDFPVPNKYFFVAPYSVGAALSNLMRNPDKLKAGLITNWDKHCSKHITNIDIKLEGDLLNYINSFDFSIFDKVTPLTLVQEHQNTPFHIPRFGGGLPARPQLKPAPKNILTHELPYINELLKAYNSDSALMIIGLDDLKDGEKYQKHFSRSREYFHQAEQLKNFSRDKLPPETFDVLKDEVFSGTVDVVEDDHDTGFICIKEVEKEARKLNIASNPLNKSSDGNDRVGICHHLANDGRLTWQGDDNDT